MVLPLDDKVDRRETPTAVTGEAHVVGEDYTDLVVTTEVPAPGYPVQVTSLVNGTYTKVTTTPAAGEFRVRPLLGLMPGALEFDATAAADAVQISYFGLGSLAKFARDFNRIHAAIRDIYLRAGADIVSADEEDFDGDLVAATAAAVALDIGKEVVFRSTYSADVDAVLGGDNAPLRPLTNAMLMPPNDRTYEIVKLASGINHVLWLDESQGGHILLPPGEISPAWFGLSRDEPPAMGLYSDGCYFYHEHPGTVGSMGRVYTEVDGVFGWHEFGLIGEE